MRLRISCGLVVCSALTETTAGVTRSATETNAFWDSSNDELATSESLEPLVWAPRMCVQSIEDAKKTPAMNATAPTARILDLEKCMAMFFSAAVVGSETDDRKDCIS